VNKNKLLLAGLVIGSALALWWYLRKSSAAATASTDSLGNALNPDSGASLSSSVQSGLLDLVKSLLPTTTTTTQSNLSGTSVPSKLAPGLSASDGAAWTRTEKGTSSNKWKNKATGKEVWLPKQHNPNVAASLSSQDYSTLGTLFASTQTISRDNVPDTSPKVHILTNVGPPGASPPPTPSPTGTHYAPGPDKPR
jgi:hypothetical protein